MTQALKMSFEEYLSLDASADLPEGFFEFVDDGLRQLRTKAGDDVVIINSLFFQMVATNLIPARLIIIHSGEVEVPVLQKGDPRTRMPDLFILRQEHLQLTRRRLTITRDMPPPLLIVEVVSPGNANQQRDYDRKRQQYEELGVLEYWLIDPHQHVITVLELQNGLYAEVGQFGGSDRILSPNFPQLTLTTDQVLTAGE